MSRADSAKRVTCVSNSNTLLTSTLRAVVYAPRRALANHAPAAGTALFFFAPFSSLSSSTSSRPLRTNTADVISFFFSASLGSVRTLALLLVVLRSVPALLTFSTSRMSRCCVCTSAPCDTTLRTISSEKKIVIHSRVANLSLSPSLPLSLSGFIQHTHTYTLNLQFLSLSLSLSLSSRRHHPLNPNSVAGF